jgi:hypothetical protein
MTRTDCISWCSAERTESIAQEKIGEKKMSASIAKSRIKQVLSDDWTRVEKIENAQRDVRLLIQAHDLQDRLTTAYLATPSSSVRWSKLSRLYLRAAARRGRRQWAIIAKLAKVE